ncbi:MAG: ATPase, T2SS/T4P/T4SS family [Nitrososphaeria archaeon]
MLFSNFFSVKRKPVFSQSPLLLELFTERLDRAQVIESYPVDVFEVSHVVLDGRHYYQITCSKDFLELMKKTKIVLNEIVDDPHIVEIDLISFSTILKHVSNIILQHLNKYVLDDHLKRKLSLIYAFEFMRLSRLLPLILDHKVQEFYSDSPCSRIYLDHVEWGRCLTNIQLTQEEIQAITTHMQTFSGYSLDYTSNSLKTDWQIDDIVCRISLDIAPLSVTGFILDARKISSKIYTLPELIKSDTLSKDLAISLLFFLNLGRNLTIIGETNSGKTTLLNSLDLFISPEKRRVYVEDVLESMNLIHYNYHQAKYRVTPYDVGVGGKTKSSEVIKILHRSPNIIVLGEIQTEEHSRALFSSLASGIRGLQTFHSTSVDQAFRRWMFSHKINPVSLNELDLIILMNKTSNFPTRRRVASVCEVIPRDSSVSTGLLPPSIDEVYTRDMNGELVCLRSFDKTHMFKKLCEVYPETYLRQLYERMYQLLSPLLDENMDFSTLVTEVSDLWCKLNEQFHI